MGSAEQTYHLTDSDLSPIYEFAIQLGKDAGRMLLDALYQRRDTSTISDVPEEKMNAVDIVTKTDTDVEQITTKYSPTYLCRRE